MIITLMGYILIPIGIILLVLKPKWLLYVTVIFSGFSGSALVLVGGDLAVQPAYYFAILWIMQQFFKGKSIKINYINIRQNKLLYIFMMLATLSIVMSVILRNQIMIINVEGKIGYLKFSSSNITQLVYLWFCFIFYVILYSYLKKSKLSECGRIIDAYLMGVLLVCVICIYQIIAFKFELPFDVLFRQNVNGNWQGSRIYGPCIEASMLCYYLASALPICTRTNGKRWKYILLLLIIILGIYSFSSSFILGLALWLMLEFANLLYKQKSRIKKNNMFLLMCLLFVGIVMCIIFRKYIEIAIYKLSDTLGVRNISGFERSKYFLLLIRAFIKSPIFGVGFGACRGTDLFSTWLANLGIIGVTPIVIYLMCGILRKSNRKEIKFANIIVWTVMLAGVPEPYNLFIWILMAILMLSSKSKKWQGCDKYERINNCNSCI